MKAFWIGLVALIAAAAVYFVAGGRTTSSPKTPVSLPPLPEIASTANHGVARDESAFFPEDQSGKAASDPQAASPRTGPAGPVSSDASTGVIAGNASKDVPPAASAAAPAAAAPIAATASDNDSSKAEPADSTPTDAKKTETEPAKTASESPENGGAKADKPDASNGGASPTATAAPGATTLPAPASAGGAPTGPAPAAVPKADAPAGKAAEDKAGASSAPEYASDANVETKPDGSMLIDSKYAVKGSGAKSDPYVITWEYLTSAEETYQPRLGKKKLPGRLKMLDGKYVKITGYIAFPIMAQEPTEMLSMLNQWDGCCIGVPPTPYDAVEVKLKDAAKGEDRLAGYGSVQGKMKIDPYLVKNWLVSLYAMEEATLTRE